MKELENQIENLNHTLKQKDREMETMKRTLNNTIV